MNSKSFLDDYEFYMTTFYERFHSAHHIKESDIEDLQTSNRQLHQNLFFFDYLRMSVISAIEAYHNQLREQLKETLQIDIGEFPV